MQDNIEELPVRQFRDDGGGGKGRLDELANKIHGIDKRLSVIEVRSRHMATKAWILGGVIAGIGTGTMLALAIARLFN